ncbi:MAG: hypothetical protein ACXWIS_22220, partial [Burkholderiales bacterium]
MKSRFFVCGLGGLLFLILFSFVPFVSFVVKALLLLSQSDALILAAAAVSSGRGERWITVR